MSEQSNQADPVVNRYFDKLFYELCPTPEDVEVAEFRAKEMQEGDISLEVLTALHEDGHRSLAPEYVPGFLLLMRKALDRIIIDGGSLRDQQHILGSFDRKQRLGDVSPSKYLSGEYGTNASLTFLCGALSVMEYAAYDRIGQLAGQLTNENINNI